MKWWSWLALLVLGCAAPENVGFFIFQTSAVDHVPDEEVRPNRVYLAWDRSLANGGAGHSCLAFYRTFDDLHVLEANSSFPSHLFLFADPAANRLYGPHHNGEGLARDLCVVRDGTNLRLKPNFHRRLLRNNFRREDFDSDDEWHEAFYDALWRVASRFNRNNTLYHEQLPVYAPTPAMDGDYPVDGYGNCNSYTASVARRAGASWPVFFAPVGWLHNVFVARPTDTRPRISEPLAAHYPFYNFVYVGAIPLKNAFPDTRSFPPVHLKGDYEPY